MRKKMTREELLNNAEKYKKQASSILDFSGKNPAKLEYNSKWLSKISLEETLELAGNFTVQQLIERDMFRQRISDRKPIGLHEFLYPILQGYDSVVMNVDLEVGGTDQTFNMLVGRTLMKSIRGKEKFVVTLPLLEGTDGRKMSKSYDNTIGISERPNEMYGKIMSLKDELIVKYFNLCTDLSKEQINKIYTQLQMKAINPMDAKKDLALEIAKQYHGPSKAKEAQKEFVKVFQKGESSSVKREVTLEKSILPVSYASLAATSGATSSVSEAIRLAENRGLRIDGNLINKPREKINKIDRNETIVDVGRRKSVKIVWR
jgi:tyrosyl-tRNA synthetase